MNAALTLTDFPDRLSPMVVKELRQGMRTRMFGLVMVGLHVLLVFLTLMSAGSSNAADVNGWFDGNITLVLCIILPLRGFSAVADELKAGTLDMLALTRLSAGRIVFGKWASIVSQSLLIALSILPYVVARYVFGGLDLFSEVLMLFYKWMAGAVITALVVALSTQRQFWLRATLIGLPMLMGGCGMASFFMVSRLGGPGSSSAFLHLSSGITGNATLIALGPLALAAWLIFYFLTLAATRIAPAASHLAVVKRSVHLGVFVILLLLGLATSLGSGAVAAASALLWLVMMDALTEQLNEVPSVYAPFYQRGWPGRVALWLLAPGWVTGFLFTLLLVALVAGATWRMSGAEAAALVVVGACGSWMIAALVHLALARRRGRDPMPRYLGYSLAVGMVLPAISTPLLMSHPTASTTAWYASVLPQMAPMGYATADAADKETFLHFALASAMVWPVLLLVGALFVWRRTRGAREEAWRMVRAQEGGGVA